MDSSAPGGASVLFAPGVIRHGATVPANVGSPDLQLP